MIMGKSIIQEIGYYHILNVKKDFFFLSKGFLGIKFCYLRLRFHLFFFFFSFENDRNLYLQDFL